MEINHGREQEERCSQLMEHHSTVNGVKPHILKMFSQKVPISKGLFLSTVLTLSIE
ncbi:hypothetical protein QJS04_geneDACA008541 [Acorus gramineus]|uniref:Uncharacterized protein n=1 Tax=Acorus gramineus TaxID=55184 RepID=A0AAV9AF48_ACOGR|nr:hypothetical protein QJS04_geneDACA008541 [Acorus gramineus]